MRNDVKYFGMDSEALRMAEGLDDTQRLAFFDQWRTDCFNFGTDNDNTPEYPKTMCGVLNLMAYNTAKYVFNTYMKRKRANHTSVNTKVETDQPINDGSLGVNGGSLGVNGIQSNQHQSIKEQLTTNRINQIHSELKQAGYSDSEIERALSGKTDRAINNPLAYIRTGIDNERRNPPKPPKKVSAQLYEQRDYSKEQSEAMQRMIDDYESGKG